MWFFIFIAAKRATNYRLATPNDDNGVWILASDDTRWVATISASGTVVMVSESKGGGAGGGRGRLSAQGLKGPSIEVNQPCRLAYSCK